MTIIAKIYKMNGREIPVANMQANVDATSVKEFSSFKGPIDQLSANEGTFLDLKLLDAKNQQISQNIYWLPDSSHNYTGLQKMERSKMVVTAKYLSPVKVEVTLTNAKQNVPAFFNRVALTDAVTRKRLLPVFYTDNYITVLPGEQKKIVIDCDAFKIQKKMLSINGWNTPLTYIDITN
jgi:hypothetical protein